MLKQIGKYTISERIGRGTYSRVYRAVDSQGRTVAIKVSTTQTEPQHLDEFQKDLVAAASVLHPNLVSVHDLGFEDDFPYLVMELVEGQDLDRLLKSNNAPSLGERIRVMEQTAGALKAAHERGIFHLDVRPSKIMLAENGEAKLLDLGLGRLSFDPARVTENGYLVGAPFYMSPERLTAIDTADERCDIWSFGVTFYEWIAGHHPFYDDDGDRMIGNIMDAVVAELHDVPPQLNHLLARALEKDPAERYQHFGELLADLQPLAGDLKREESDALMAEALKQTDSGRWHEARRIARQLREMDPAQQAPSSQIFGITEPEAEKEKPAERVYPAAPPAAPPQQTLAAASSMAAAAAAVAATAIQTPEPTRYVAETQAAPVSPPPPPAPPLPRAPQRPERTAPKIPAMGLRNGSATPGENGSSVAARVPATPVPPSNGARTGARETETPAPKFESGRVDRIRPASAPGRTTTPVRPSPTPAQSQPTVRILGIEDQPSNFPWAKILGFSIPALLMIGLLAFFLRSGGKVKPFAGSEDAREARAGRVITPDDKHGDAAATPPDISATAPVVTPPAANADGTPLAATGDPLNPTAPRSFDPKTLSATKLPAVTKRRGTAPAMAAPSIGGAPEGSDVGGLPLALNAPPPPAPVVVPPPTATPTQATPAKVATPPPAPAAGSTPLQSVEAARESAGHVGGVFTQPVLVRTVQPIYPPAAVQRKSQATIRFQATIAKDGSVKNIQLVSGDPMFNVAARQAVGQWKYKPATLNGDAIEVTQAIVVNFNLNNR